MREHLNDFADLAKELRDFAEKRDWSRFHSPKKLAMALAGEAGELVAEFQWLTEAESYPTSLAEDQIRAIEMEIADVQIYLIRLADVLGIDLPVAVRAKMKINEDRF